jgi:hypothetical protein
VITFHLTPKRREDGPDEVRLVGDSADVVEQAAASIDVPAVLALIDRHGERCVRC